MTEPLRVGVIGLGRCWRTRYRPALAALGDRLAVRVVTDPSARRTTAVARALGCTAAPGVLSLLEGELDAVLLLGRPWYRLWPLEQACRLGRPVFCTASLAQDEAYAEELVRRVRVSGLTVMVEPRLRLAPAAERLARLVGRIGPIRSVIATAERRRPGSVAARVAGLALLDWCAGLFGRAPEAVRGLGESPAGHTGWLAGFSGPVAQIVTWPGGDRRSRVRLRIIGERGTADAVLPCVVRWRRGAVRHTIVLPPGPPPAQVALERFYVALTSGQPPTPGLAAAYQALAWLRSAR